MTTKRDFVLRGSCFCEKYYYETVNEYPETFFNIIEYFLC